MLETIEGAAYPPARQRHPRQCPYAGAFPSCRVPGDPPRPWLPVGIQPGCVRAGVDAGKASRCVTPAVEVAAVASRWALSGRRAYVLTGYLNVPKILEVTLHNGVDPVSGRKVGLETGDPRGFRTYEEFSRIHAPDPLFRGHEGAGQQLYRPHVRQVRPRHVPPLFIDDCIAKGKDYYNCGPRYNTTYIQCTGLGTITDSLSSLRKHVFEDKTFTMEALLDAMADNFEGHEPMRQMILNRTPFFWQR